ncbi:MAG: Nif3-like dinuclear metal center hexameric protein [Planctomycetes bacterium SCN 63-9]|nr:MAG: Nif3-like dinuclear metal center hexameric protein [Planctomycetes bacterium SCN 63-9]
MTTVAELVHWLEAFAPSRLAENWDNVGFLWGDLTSPIQRAMTCLTVTPAVTDEAIAEGAGMIVSHHPILFRGTKRLRADLPETGFLWRLAREGIAIASPHTAFDNTKDGINDLLAKTLGLVDLQPLRPPAAPSAAPVNCFKVVVFVPESDREAVMAAGFGAGGGKIGHYGECSFSSDGVGTFLGDETTNPTIGEKGRRESVREQRLEMICASGALAAVLDAIRRAHSYEEPAIDVYPLHVPPRAPTVNPGVGRIGRLPVASSLDTFADKVRRALRLGQVQVVGDPARSVERVAIACGAGADFLADAAKAGADLLFTGEARFHRGFEAEALGLGLIVAGHHATERIGVEDLALRLASAFPGLTVWASRREADPFRTIGP